jgi:hypothetical protein
LLDSIAFVSCEERRAEASAENGVASRGLIADGDVGVVIGLEARENEVRPARVVKGELSITLQPELTDCSYCRLIRDRL